LLFKKLLHQLWEMLPYVGRYTSTMNAYNPCSSLFRVLLLSRFKFKEGYILHILQVELPSRFFVNLLPFSLNNRQSILDKVITIFL